MYIQAENRGKDFQNYTLIVPAVSVGNVGQLAADLIISTLWMERIGYIYHDSILPVIGNDPFAHPDSTNCKLVTSCEVYESVLQKLVVIQQRSPFVKGKMWSFRKWLVDWIKQMKFEKVVILTSSHSHERLDFQLQGSQFRYLASQDIEASHGHRLHDNQLNWQELEKRSPYPDLTEGRDDKNDAVVYIPGGGIAKTLYEECCKEDLSVIVLLTFCAEGDNAEDAIKLAYQLNDWLDLVDFRPKYDLDGKTILKPATSWKIPVSWRLPFGTRMDQSLFY